MSNKNFFIFSVIFPIAFFENLFFPVKILYTRIFPIEINAGVCYK